MTFKPENATVWAEIPVTDMDRAKEFYKALGFAEFAMMEGGPNPVAVFQTADPANGVAGHLYPGKPAPRGTGPTVHLAAPDALTVLAERVTAAGGKVLSPPITIPAGNFIYCEDLDGNSLGLFRAA